MGRRSVRAARRGRQPSVVKEGFWRRHVTNQSVGSLTVRDYCGEHGLAEPSFYGWRREIARRDRAATRDAVGRPSAQDRGAPDFVRLEVGPVSSKHQPIEIVLPGGVRVLVPATATSDQLREVLAALNEVSAGGPRSC